MESIYGCLERIENKINCLSIPQSADGNSKVYNTNDVAMQEFKQDLNGIKTSFNRLAESIVAIRSDTTNLLKHSSMADKAMESLSMLNNEHQQSRKQQNDCSNRIVKMLSELGTKQIHESNEIKSLLRATDEHIKNGVYYEKHHSFSIESPFIFWGFCGMFAMIIVLAVALYFAKQSDCDRIDNDLKYRYIKMKSEISSEGILELENIFELNRDNDKIRQMRKDVETYEDCSTQTSRTCRASPTKGTGSKRAGRQGKVRKIQVNQNRPT